jgi:hypothetical protein
VRFFIFKIENRYLYFNVGWVSILQNSYIGLLLQCDIATYMLTQGSCFFLASIW